jgi:ribosome assembly protein YihI (activator of Der GTPase)
MMFRRISSKSLENKKKTKKKQKKNGTFGIFNAISPVKYNLRKESLKRDPKKGREKPIPIGKRIRTPLLILNQSRSPG